jgi:hypothetical protein
MRFPIRAMAMASAVLLAVMTSTFVGCASHTSASSADVCGAGADSSQPPSIYDHVIWIFEENHNLSYDPKDPEAGIIGNPAAPFINDLAKTCSYSSSFIDTHPGMHSEPHYLAAISGSNCNTGYGTTIGTGCITDDKSPRHHMLNTDNILSQLERSGKTWISYQESSPSNCFRSGYPQGPAPLYAPKHDPALFFTNISQSCRANDVPISGWTSGTPKGRLAEDITADTLPAFAVVTPNLQNDMHISTGGNAAKGDRWLAAYLPFIFDSSSYRSGRTAVFVLWDETYNGQTKLSPNLIIAPTARPGPTANAMNNVSVLRATQLMLGLAPQLPFLGCASGKPPGSIGQCPRESVADVRHAANI